MDINILKYLDDNMDIGGQLSADFLFATLLLIIILGALTSIVSSGMDTANNAEFAKAKVLADSVSRSINSVYTNGEGQYLAFSFPKDFNYTVTINNNGVTVTYKGKNAASSLIPKDINTITINPGESYNFTNNDGKMQIIPI